jgi:hypothetical protein
MKISALWKRLGDQSGLGPPKLWSAMSAAVLLDGPANLIAR